MLVDVTEGRLGEWAEELAVLLGGLGHLFARPEPREVFADLVEGLLSGVPGGARELPLCRCGR
jgi:hypothetical protein